MRAAAAAASDDDDKEEDEDEDPQMTASPIASDMTSLGSTSDPEDNDFAKDIDTRDHSKQTFSAFGFAESASLNSRRKQQNPRRQSRNDSSESSDSSSSADQQSAPKGKLHRCDCAISAPIARPFTCRRRSAHLRSRLPALGSPIAGRI